MSDAHPYRLEPRIQRPTRYATSRMMRELQARMLAARGGQEPRATRRSLVRLRHETINSKTPQDWHNNLWHFFHVAEHGRRNPGSDREQPGPRARRAQRATHGSRCIRASQLIPSNRPSAARLSLAMRARRLAWSDWPEARRSMAWMVTRGLRTLQASRTWRVLSLGSLGCG